LGSLPERKGDILEDGKMGPNSVGLKDHSEIAFLRRNPDGRIVAKNRAIGDSNLAGIRCLQSSDAAQ
jgi:hypothetical protein